MMNITIMIIINNKSNKMKWEAIFFKMNIANNYHNRNKKVSKENLTE
jgi:hypothetical protein